MKNFIPNSDSFSIMFRSLFLKDAYRHIKRRLLYGLFVFNLGFPHILIARAFQPLDCIPKLNNPQFVCMIDEKGNKINAAADLSYPVQKSIDHSGLKAPVDQ
jgi:hypothetical protein